MPPRVSIIVANYNGAHVLPDCIETLLQQDCRPFEVIVADNASVDESIEVIRRYPVRLVALDENRGVSAAYNRGAAAAGGEVLAFFNNDMRFPPECVGALAEALTTGGDDIFAADALQLNWEGNRVIHGRAQLHRGSFLRGLLPGIELRFETESATAADIPWGNSANLMVWADKFQSLGGWDEGFFCDWEDVDVCWRAWLRGWRTVFVPTARVYHRTGVSYNVSPPDLQRRRRIFQEASRQRFLLKTMSGRLLVALAFQLLLRIGGYAATGQPQRSLLILQGLWANLRQSVELRRQRRAILDSAESSSPDILKRFLAASLPNSSPTP